MTNQKILVIDDSKDELSLMARVLSAEGFEVLTAIGGADGLQMAQKHKPALTVLDINMPDIHGDQVLEEIKRRGIPTRVIMHTAHYKTVRDIVRYIKAGACDYLLKPIDIDELGNTIKRALALDDAISFVTSEKIPLVHTLIVKTEELEHKKQELEEQILQLRAQLGREKEGRKEQIRQLQRRKSGSENIARLVYLLIACVITVIFYKLGMVTNTQSLFFFPLVIFVLMLFPIERIRLFSAKHRDTEATVEVQSNKE